MSENTPCTQCFVNTLAKEMQGEDDKNIAAEYSDLELVTDLKSQSGKPIQISIAKPNSGQVGEIFSSLKNTNELL